jgi:hypothetical protein
LHTVRPELRGLAHSGPARRRLRWTPPKITNWRRSEWDAFEGFDAVVDNTLEVAALHAHDGRLRLGECGGSHARRGRDAYERAQQKAHHS